MLVAVYAVAILFEALTMTIAFKLFDPNISGSEFVAFFKKNLIYNAIVLGLSFLFELSLFVVPLSAIPMIAFSGNLIIFIVAIVILMKWYSMSLLEITIIGVIQWFVGWLMLSFLLQEVISLIKDYS